MIVLFTSQCQKKAIERTNRVLDTFADRIGDRTWRAIITNEGLLAVKKLLKKTATKNTAVACHYIHGHKNFELLWIVGNRDCFNKQGIVPVGRTSRQIINTQWENRWDYLEVIQSTVSMAALFHDWGKSSVIFQEKLKKSKRTKDPFRHEWISSLFVAAISELSNNDDRLFLQCIAAWNLNTDTIVKKVLEIQTRTRPFENLPSFVFSIIWLIISHHFLPYLKKENLTDFIGIEYTSIEDYKKILNSQWGYFSDVADDEIDQSSCLLFQEGLPCDSPSWVKEVKKRAYRCLSCFSLFEKAEQSHILRPLLYYARLSLMYGDHLYSSRNKDTNWSTSLNLYANTNKNGKRNQFLDEHLVGVEKDALTMVHLLPRFEQEFSYAIDNNRLEKKASPASPYNWQDKAVEKIITWRKSHNVLDEQNPYGFFGVNLASTGYGKTFANAKIMKALSKDGDRLRYVLCLGLRTLTLQTGDEYRNRIGFDETEMGVIIGSQAIEQLHEQHRILDDESYFTSSLFEGNIDYEATIPEDRLSIILEDEKSKKLLYAPVLVCTIDYMMQATEQTSGGKWMLPFIRMMSSELVIDEIDDFSGSDLVAIGRLISLAGMLGKKVLLSSATIPPDMAKGYYCLYQDGWNMFAKSRNTPAIIGCAWIDEFGTTVELNIASSSDDSVKKFEEDHEKFVQKRCDHIMRLEQSGVKRKGIIVRCDELKTYEEPQEQMNGYFELIKEEAVRMHHLHALTDKQSNKRVSFGCIRMAHIDPCIELSKYLLNAEYPEDFDVRVMPYHSRQVLLLRNEQEKQLDRVLKCKNRNDIRIEAFSNPLIRLHLDSAEVNNIIFILVATPVEEIGRDHDFDWAIVEPSSYRSFIQLAGRVQRHRNKYVNTPNIAIMQYNLYGLNKSNDEPVFCRPGFETTELLLESHDLTKLVDEEEISRAINACPRIKKRTPLYHKKNLIDLEHFTMEQLLGSYQQKGCERIGGWLSNSGWWLTGLPQIVSPFRQSDQYMEQVYLFLNDDDELTFGTFENSEKHFIPREKILGIRREEISPLAHTRLWMERDYYNLLEVQMELTGETRLIASLKYGEIQIPGNSQGFVYSDQFGMGKEHLFKGGRINGSSFGEFF